MLNSQSWPTVDGAAVPVAEGEDDREVAVARAALVAVKLGRPVRARLTEPDGAVWILAVDADCEETVLEEPAQLSRRERRKRERERERARVAAERAAEPAPTEPVAWEPAAWAEPAAPDEPVAWTEPVAWAEPGPDPAAPPLASTPAPPPAQAPVSAPNPAFAQPQPQPPAPTPTPASEQEAVAGVLAATDAGDLRTALELCARWEEGTSAGLGPEHPSTLRARELRARIAALAGQHVLACELRLRLAGDSVARLGAAHPDTRAAVDEAQQAWLAVTDRIAARRLGAALLELRTAVPSYDSDPTADMRTQLTLRQIRESGTADDAP